MDLREFIDLCEKEGDVKRVTAEVDWDLEMTHIAKLVEEANNAAHAINQEMEGITQRTENMEALTTIQAGRSKTLIEVTSESANAAKQTVSGAGQVVGITEDLKQLSAALNQQVAQFKIGNHNGGARA